jgi:hypothetical protein
MSHHQNPGPGDNIDTIKKYTETLIDSSKELACYHSVQKSLSFYLLSKNVKIRIYKTVILPVVLYGCETWSLTLRDGHTMRMFGKEVLRRIFGKKSDKMIGS